MRRSLLLIKQAPLTTLIVNFHQFDDALSRIGETLLALHYPLYFFLLDVNWFTCLRSLS